LSCAQRSPRGDDAWTELSQQGAADRDREQNEERNHQIARVHRDRVA
jgi:hypothetical protein